MNYICHLQPSQTHIYQKMHISYNVQFWTIVGLQIVVTVLYLLIERFLTPRESLGVFKRLWNSNDHRHPGEKSIATLRSWKMVMCLGNSRILLIDFWHHVENSISVLKLFPSQKPVQEMEKSRKMEIYQNNGSLFSTTACDCQTNPFLFIPCRAESEPYFGQDRTLKLH